MKTLLRFLRRFLPADDSRTGWSYSDKATLPNRVGWDYRRPACEGERLRAQ